MADVALHVVLSGEGGDGLGRPHGGDAHEHAKHEHHEK
jgi:hypothetical protein